VTVKKELIIVFAALIIAVTLLSALIITSNAPAIHSPTGRATQSAQGVLSLCINNPPFINITADQTAVVDTAFTLQINASDANSNSLTFTDNTSLFAINSSGFISFTPVAGDITVHSILITVDDNTNCANRNTTRAFNLTISAPAAEAPAAEAPAAGGGGGGAGAAAAPRELPSQKIPFTPIPYPFSLSNEQEVFFIANGQQYFLETTSIETDSVAVRLSSANNAQTINLQVGEIRYIDIDNDAIADVYLRLDSTQNNQANLVIKSTREGFILSEETLKVALRESELFQRNVSAISDWFNPIEIGIENPLAQLLTISPLFFELPADEIQELSLIFNELGNARTGVYPGVVNVIGTIEGFDLIKYLTIVLEVESEEVLFDASLDLLKKVFAPGEELRATIGVFNLRRVVPEANVTLTYNILDLEGVNYYEEQETLTINEQASFTKTVVLPRNVTDGGYVFALKIQHEDSFASATELFTVESPDRAPLVGLAAFFGTSSALALAIPLLLTSTILILVILYYLHQKVKISHVLIKNKTTPKIRTRTRTINKRAIIKDTSHIKRKLILLEESLQNGFIKEETYLKAKEKLKRMLK
jgi:hypothetical protein